jgi:hypothetical protein
VKRLLLVPVLAVLLLLSACGDGDESVTSSPSAAPVNGAEISEDELLGQLHAAATVEGYGTNLLGLQQSVTGESPGTYSTDASAAVLTTLVVFELMQQEVADRDLEITDADRDSAEESLVQALGVSPETGQPDPDAGAAALDELTDDEKATVIDGLAAASVLSQEFAAEAEPVEVDDAAVRAYYDENVEQFSAEESCARHILVTAGDPESGVEPTEEEVAAARTEIEEIAAEIDAGGDFATLAAERSDDTGSAPDGGDLSCNPRETFIPEFDEALWGLEVGAVSGPVESEAGVHLILVYDRRTPTFDDVAEEIRAQLESQSEQDTQAASQAGFEAWFSEAVTAADVTVDPRYGTWGFFTIDQETGTETEVERDEAMFARVVPPGGPTTTTGSTLPLVDPLAPPITTE